MSTMTTSILTTYVTLYIYSKVLTCFDRTQILTPHRLPAAVRLQKAAGPDPHLALEPKATSTQRNARPSDSC